MDDSIIDVNWIKTNPQFIINTFESFFFSIPESLLNAIMDVFGMVVMVEEQLWLCNRLKSHH